MTSKDLFKALLISILLFVALTITAYIVTYNANSTNDFYKYAPKQDFPTMTP